MRTIRTLPLLLAIAGLAAADAPLTVVGRVHDQLASGKAAAVPVIGDDAAARARLERLATAIKTGGWDFTPQQERIDGDCAAVLVQGSRNRSGGADRFALYLVDDGSGWRLLPDPTRPLVANAARQARLEGLATWVAEATRPEPVSLASGAAATWMMGSATINGQTLRPGAPIAMGQTIAVSAAKPGRLLFNDLKESSVNLAPGTVIALVEDPIVGGTDLVIDLQEGAVQVDVHALGTYKHVRVRGFASDVLVTGTIFLVQRVSNDQDYVAQVQGTVKVRKKNGNGQEVVELRERQGVGVSGDTGFASVDKLSVRPQLTPERLATGNIRDQATTTSTINSGAGDAGGWKTDAVQQQAPTVASSSGSNGGTGQRSTAGTTTKTSSSGGSTGSSASTGSSPTAPTTIPTTTSPTNDAPSDIVMPTVAAASTPTSGSGSSSGSRSGSGSTGSSSSSSSNAAASAFSSMIGVMNPGLGNQTGSNPSTSTGGAAAIPGATTAGGTTAPAPAAPLTGRPGFPN